MDPVVILFAISFIIIFGVFAEFIFKKLDIPDVLFLILLGFVVGPHALNLVSPDMFAAFAPAFTTFTLLFLLFDGAFNIDLVSFAKGIYYGMGITLFNFIISTAVIGAIMYAFGYSIIISILTGFILGGISSSFVIPIIKQLSVKKEVFSILTLESAFTDVFCIVFALTAVDLIAFGQFQFQVAVSKVVSLFAIAALIGIIAGILWVVIELKVFKEYKSYMLTIAFLLLVYVVTDYLKGNGAIAALFFGLVLRNSKQLISISKGMVTKVKTEKKKAITGELGVSVAKPSETFFYDQISFFLKTFFFVYIGVLIDISNYWLLMIGGIIAVAVFFSRHFSSLVTRGFTKLDRRLITSFSARGLAAAALAQIVVQQNVPKASEIAIIVYVVVTASIILSSVRVFIYSLQREQAAPQPTPANASKKDKKK